jgi:hypothetical protein
MTPMKARPASIWFGHSTEFVLRRHVRQYPCVRMAEALPASTGGDSSAVLGPRLATKTPLLLEVTPFAAPSAMTALAHSFRTGTGRYDPFGKPSANDRYLRNPPVHGTSLEGQQR